MSSPVIADRRRHRIDTIATVGIRVASLLVMVAIIGMLLQLVWSALPLLKNPTPQSLPVATLPISLSDLQPTRPSWVPRQFDKIVWESDGKERVWVANSDVGLTGGRLLKRNGLWVSDVQLLQMPTIPPGVTISA